ncbi:BppU family phage baseplate upper protein [Brochothrix campestris]|uniref:BppU N-terminal domain-containing protein n=1 Tax=Brochothrix campestris FSL F6-1037 TaxID=1265861 RepID=W7C4F2_9LIST|nr:BppU family phage baseplate upper protein [Brochothrix campestris]EUJ34284.1 hypothetical protein BCAMP_12461 [Brochothrix campestris FSL F6-1037]
MTNISKVAKITTEVTATYQPLSDLNVAFYNQDINTSILQFSVTRNKTAVPLGKTNVEGYIVLLAADGSRIQDNVTITNELNGVIEYVIPTEFLKHTGKVIGQIYIAVKGKDDVAVMRQFTFDVKNDLLTGFSAEIKLEYIKTFHDLERIINERVKAIETAIANGEDYVTQMNETLSAGKVELAATATAAKTEVTTTATTAKKTIADTSNAAVSTVTAKAKEVTDAIAAGAVVKTTDTSEWQKYKITEETGAAITVNGLDLLATNDLTMKNVYVTEAKNAPSNIGASGYFKRNVRSTGYIEVFYSSFGNNAVYRNAYNAGTSSWLGWVQLANQADVTALKGTNTGWLPLTLLNGVTASTTCYYRFFSTNGIYYLSLKGVLNTITTPNTVIAKLPATVTAQLDRSLTWVGNTSNLTNTAKTNRWTISANGDIAFTSSNFGTAGESGAWNPLDVTLTL